MVASSFQSRLAERLFYSESGRIVVSVVLALGIAMLFRKVCKDRSCIVLRAPPLAELNKYFYELEGDCYKYTPYAVPCVNAPA